MHENSLKNLQMFPKGKTGNIHGRNRIPFELRGIRSLTQMEVIKIISKFARMTKEELVKNIKDASLPVIELAIASIFNHSISRGDYMRLNFLLDRCIGRVREIPEHDEDLDAREEITKLTVNELLTIVRNNLPHEL